MYTNFLSANNQIRPSFGRSDAIRNDRKPARSVRLESVSEEPRAES